MEGEGGGEKEGEGGKFGVLLHSTLMYDWSICVQHFCFAVSL